MKSTKILWIIIMIIGLFWVYYLFLANKFFPKKELIVPDVVGLTEPQMEEVLNENKVKYNIFYVDGEQAIVQKTFPKAGSKIYETYYIDVYVYNKMPKYYEDFTGLLFDDEIKNIENFCKNYDLLYKVVYVVDNSYPQGQIIWQSLTSDDVIKSGDELVFKVVINDDYIQMPNLAGMNIIDAMKLLDKFQLNYNVIYYYAPIQEDTVVFQSVLEGTLIKKGNAYSFDIYVSKGMPSDVSTISLVEFVDILQQLNYEYEVIYVDSTLKSDNIIKINYGNGIEIYVAK
ncbi:TPA: PASTA domain-containing protein [Candidatus Avacholeplasma faecigallinarum]|nr:PASTA domain-containing protein [Candidatus Avacholeplasma faecigallinarum]